MQALRKPRSLQFRSSIPFAWLSWVSVDPIATIWCGGHVWLENKLPICKKRAEIQKKIQKLNARRKKYIAEKQKEWAKSGEDTLDAAMIKSIRSQAVKKNFQFE